MKTAGLLSSHSEGEIASENSPKTALSLVDTTPAMQQFFSLKQEYQGYLLFYRMGDFYEMFFEDAKIAADILDIALTKRGKHSGEDIPMCGVPVHSSDTYLEKLIASGQKVAICEQLETPEEAKKRGYKAIVKRDVVRIVTPGTILEENLLDARQSNYLAALSEMGGECAVAWVDISTGEFRMELLECSKGDGRENIESDLANLLGRIQPREILVADSWFERERQKILTWKDQCSLLPASQFDSAKAGYALRTYYNLATLDVMGTLARAEVSACGVLIYYLELTQKATLPKLDLPRRTPHDGVMAIDPATMRNLELLLTMNGKRKGSLLSVIDKTITGSGSRLLASMLMAPLTSKAEIEERLARVECYLTETAVCTTIRENLRLYPDMERALSRLASGRGGPRDLASVREGLRAARHMKETVLLAFQAVKLREAGFVDPREVVVRDWQDAFIDEGVVNELRRAIAPEPSLFTRDGNFIASGYSAPLDEFRKLKTDGQKLIAEMESRYQKETDIGTLKIRFNNILGYFIEITSMHQKKVPEYFIHRQSMANALRYTTVELSDLERRISEASDRALKLELELFEMLRARVVEAGAAIRIVARAVSITDAASSLAELAKEENYTKPVISEDAKIAITEGRHPVVESMLSSSGLPAFIGNDCALGDAQRVWLLTGPNMAGKSTFLRQNAIITILAQMGSYVPAKAATIGIVDRLFSRVGAADDLARGQSTFMVEMIETATILNQATTRSLVILDEIGRGTATYDGLSIAWAVVEYLHEKIGCRSLFATHYHELTHLAATLKSLTCYTMKVKEWEESIVFLHQVEKGTANRSYGIHVAQLAGLPNTVTKRATEILHLLEAGKDEKVILPLTNDLPLFAKTSPASDNKFDALKAQIEATNPDAMSPKEALEFVYKLKAGI
jgi:DNA mismatch repair protein MutS